MNKSEKPLDRPLINKVTDPATPKCITDDTIPHLLVCWLTRTIVLSLMLWAGSNCSKIWCQGLSGLILFSTNIPLIFSVTILRVSDTDIIHQVSSVTLNVSTHVTLQKNILQSIEPFTILTMARKATFGVNTNVGHTLQYWISQPAIPFVPEV